MGKFVRVDRSNYVPEISQKCPYTNLRQAYSHMWRSVGHNIFRISQYGANLKCEPNIVAPGLARACRAESKFTHGGKNLSILISGLRRQDRALPEPTILGSHLKLATRPDILEMW